MERFSKLSGDAGVIFLLALSELVIGDLSGSDGFSLAAEAMDKCRHWVRHKDIEAYRLYEYLENIDETDVMTYMMTEKDSGLQNVWLCIADALAYTIAAAYRYEGQKYVPQTIENVDCGIAVDFMQNFALAHRDITAACKLLDYMSEECQEKTGDEIDMDAIRALLADND